MCGGFTCSKNALTALNIMYIVVSFILIGVATYGRASSMVTNITIFGAVIACGSFLFLLSLVGLIGAVKHHQVLLFFYMVILFLLFVVQFSVACACLAMTEDQERELAHEGWERASASVKAQAESLFHCCGFERNTSIPAEAQCQKTPTCCTPSAEFAPLSGAEEDCECQGCWSALHLAIRNGLKITGGVGMFFSFTEFLGVWLTVRYRNQKDPRANPSAFL
ncbi:tetraspanin-13-like isoform X2 [Ornithodoros turicata]|uniref:Putative tetraspanin 97e isoform d tetraspanin 97e isoform d n=1 Tax=Ornithodoros turicata TaxID=34597 RepID=A0A2R5LK75_9ACAR